jgi:hypothetical protein
MDEESQVTGHIVEASERGLFYHRSGFWQRYLTPAEGYVWSPAQVAAIHSAGKGWKIRPAFAHPAIHDVTVGLTVLTGGPVPLDKLEIHEKAAERIPNNGGAFFDLKAATSRIPSQSIVDVSMSL